MSFKKFDLQFFGEELDEEKEDTLDTSSEEEEGVDVPDESLDQDALNETLNQMQEELDEKSSEIGQLKEKIDSVTESVKSLMLTLGIVGESNDSGTEGCEALKQEIENLESAVGNLTEERDSLLEMVSNFKAESIERLAEQIANTKVLLGDISEDSKQEEINRLIEKSEETLQFVKEELDLRCGSAKPSNSNDMIPRVSNPGLVENIQKNSSITKVEETNSKKPKIEEMKEKLSPDSIFKGLLTGNKNLI